MTIARKQLVDPTVTRWYHCISRCVRAAFLMGEGRENRKQWVEDRLQKLTKSFSVSVGGFAILDNHLHVLCRLDPDNAIEWTDQEVVKRWIEVYPPRTLDLNDEKIVAMWVEHQAKDEKRVALLRERLSDLGWFMKALKEPLARRANKEDECRGTFWEARYKSIAILDTEALLATCAYIDLNPLAAGIAQTPETSQHTSIKQRVNHVRCKGEIKRLQETRRGSVAASNAAGEMEQDHWLVPVEDRRARTKSDACREGMLDTFSLGSYLMLVEYTGRLFRKGKANMNATVKDVFARLETSSESWFHRMEQMLSSSSLRGTFFASSNKTVQAIAAEKDKRMANLKPQVAT